MSEDCAICGVPLKDTLTVELNCGHNIFHYECLLKAYMSTRKNAYKYRNHCPLCRKKTDYLPIVNGITKPIEGIHYEIGSQPPEITSVRCQHKLTRGVNKGKLCGKKCRVGSTFCKAHLK